MEVASRTVYHKGVQDKAREILDRGIAELDKFIVDSSDLLAGNQFLQHVLIRIACEGTHAFLVKLASNEKICALEHKVDSKIQKMGHLLADCPNEDVHLILASSKHVLMLKDSNGTSVGKLLFSKRNSGKLQNELLKTADSMADKEIEETFGRSFLVWKKAIKLLRSGIGGIDKTLRENPHEFTISDEIGWNVTMAVVSDKSAEFMPIMEAVQLRILGEDWLLTYANNMDWMVANELNFSAATDNVRLELLKHKDILGKKTKMNGTLIGSIMRHGGPKVTEECQKIPEYGEVLRREESKDKAYLSEYISAIIAERDAALSAKAGLARLLEVQTKRVREVEALLTARDGAATPKS